MTNRPDEPSGNSVAWYRDWEVGFDEDADKWSRSGWRAYKGGCDLDARQVSASTFVGCLDEIDEAEDD